MDKSEFRILEKNGLFYVQRYFKDILRLRHIFPPFPKREYRLFYIDREGNMLDDYNEYAYARMSAASLQDAEHKLNTLLKKEVLHTPI